MKKILLVFGTRPEAIKMAPLVLEFKKRPDLFETLVCVTGQHREMLDQVLQLFEIVPDYDLNIMKAGQDLYDVTAGVILGMRQVLKQSGPDAVLVHGDTSTSTAAALAAYYQQIGVGHVEAGLRTGNIYSPWPEEMNRQLTGRLATWHFAPTRLSRENLLREGIAEEKILVTGNTVIDALHLVTGKIAQTPQIGEQVLARLELEGLKPELCRLWMARERRLVLITGHRRESFGEGFISICEAIRALGRKFPETDFVYPMHLNPNVRHAIKEVFGEVGAIRSDPRNPGLHNVHFTEPLDYLPFVYLMNLSHLVLTDSGGIQEEAPGLGKPVLVMRNTTERPEALEAGTVRLTGTDKDKIIGEVSRLLTDNGHYRQMSSAGNPYGDGKACSRIVHAFELLGS
ncbi:MAG: UDP-N-acetylglucosamine 2-epimerase (non-hydrolyzing) [Prolixibacteraceae bacterium]